jgi:hypothetical protein
LILFEAASVGWVRFLASISEATGECRGGNREQAHVEHDERDEHFDRSESGL